MFSTIFLYFYLFVVVLALFLFTPFYLFLELVLILSSVSHPIDWLDRPLFSLVERLSVFHSESVALKQLCPLSPAHGFFLHG